MKKLLTLAAIALFGVSTTFAQTSTTVKQAPKKTVTATKAETKKAEKKATSTKLKADGTPDMRYKENKAVKANTAGPKKKDGTADMRTKRIKLLLKRKGKHSSVISTAAKRVEKSLNITLRFLGFVILRSK